MRCAARPILPASTSWWSCTRHCSAESFASVWATSSAVRVVSRRQRSKLATTTTQRRPSARVTSQAALFAVGTGTHAAVGAVDASRASAHVGSRCNCVAKMCSNPCPATTSTLSLEIRPRSATTQIRPTPNRSAKSFEHSGQGGDIGGVAGEHVMGDRDPVARAQQPDDDLRAGRSGGHGCSRTPSTGTARRVAGRLRSRSTSRRSRPAAGPGSTGHTTPRRARSRSLPCARRQHRARGSTAAPPAPRTRPASPRRARPTPAGAASSTDRRAGWRPSRTPRQPTPRHAARRRATSNQRSRPSRCHTASTAATDPTAGAASAAS